MTVSRKEDNMAPQKSTTPPGSVASGKNSVASSLSEVSLPELGDSKSRSSSQAASYVLGSSNPGTSMSGSLAETPTGSVRADSALSTSVTRSASPRCGSPAYFWRGIGDEQEIIFVKPLDPRFECALCKKILRYPSIMECGHHCCCGCMQELMRTEPRCPIDQAKVEKANFTTDRNLQKEIETLFVRCSFVSAGCTWTGYLKELQMHTEVCKYRSVVCPNECGANFEQRFLEGHLKSDCPRRVVHCEYCQDPIKLDELEAHFSDCRRFKIECTNCGTADIPREELQKHLDTECPEEMAKCSFFEAGCPFESKRKDLKAHITENLELHVDMVVMALQTCSDALEIHDAILERQSDRLIDVENQAAVLNKIHGYQMLWKIDNYANKMQEAEEGISVAIESPIFWLSRDGYRIQLSACLNGDGKAAGEYMSLYVSIVRGEYDALLKWPFSLPLTISLLDHNKNPSKRKDHHQVLRPNACVENMPFLKRPTSSRNPAFGLVRFIRLDKFKEFEYVKNDTLFVKVQADPKGILKL
ncbi:hypothetical protein LSH36_247g01074 [Paralvinella palmiformis]|uniref:TNF receptor-associated factor n=1 Tax=Paralvinella palmiformis TaxID=53620 RepID=A0AAD9JL10_9ANNE|nr:hypothetical protein LSH36_247g01074 [Paralvinella palmiformis]